MANSGSRYNDLYNSPYPVMGSRLCDLQSLRMWADLVRPFPLPASQGFAAI